MRIGNAADLPEAEWLEWHRKGIGGSDAAAIFGISPFATGRDLYYDKVGFLPHEETDEDWVQKQVGHLLEVAKELGIAYKAVTCLLN